MSIIGYNTFKDKQTLSKELTDWRRRLKLCVEFEWRDPCFSICKSEVERLRKLVEGDDIITRMSRLK